jgi:hypothetical protein
MYKLNQWIFACLLVTTTLVAVAGTANNHVMHAGNNQNQQQTQQQNQQQPPADQNGRPRNPNKAVNKQNRALRLQMLKNAYMNRKLGLTEEQAQKFWPLYNACAAELFAVQRQRKQDPDNEILYEEQLLNIRKKYKKAYESFLPPDKVKLIYKAEKEFQDELIKALSEKRTDQAN